MSILDDGDAGLAQLAARSRELSSGLDALLAETTAAHARFEAAVAREQCLVLLDRVYTACNAAHRAQWAGFSAAYLSGTEPVCLAGKDLPPQVAWVFLVAVLDHAARVDVD